MGVFIGRKMGRSVSGGGGGGGGGYEGNDDDWQGQGKRLGTGSSVQTARYKDARYDTPPRHQELYGSKGQRRRR